MFESTESRSCSTIVRERLPNGSASLLLPYKGYKTQECQARGQIRIYYTHTTVGGLQPIPEAATDKATSYFLHICKTRKDDEPRKRSQNHIALSNHSKTKFTIRYQTPFRIPPPLTWTHNKYARLLRLSASAGWPGSRIFSFLASERLQNGSASAYFPYKIDIYTRDNIAVKINYFETWTIIIIFFGSDMLINRRQYYVGIGNSTA